MRLDEHEGWYRGRNVARSFVGGVQPLVVLDALEEYAIEADHRFCCVNDEILREVQETSDDLVVGEARHEDRTKTVGLPKCRPVQPGDVAVGGDRANRWVVGLGRSRRSRCTGEHVREEEMRVVGAGKGADAGGGGEDGGVEGVRRRRSASTRCCTADRGVRWSADRVGVRRKYSPGSGCCDVPILRAVELLTSGFCFAFADSTGTFPALRSFEY